MMVSHLSTVILSRVATTSTNFFLFVVSRPELVPWLQEQILEQKRIDAETSGTTLFEHSQGPVRSKPSGPMPDVRLVLPGDSRKQRKQTKQIFLEKGESFPIHCTLSNVYCFLLLNSV